MLMAAALALSGCAPLGQAATPATGELQKPPATADPAAFKTELLQALAEGDPQQVRTYMAEPFYTGIWFQGWAETGPDQALQTLYASQLGAANRLAPVADAELAAQMCGGEPLPIPGSPESIPFWVRGWGLDGGDDALLYLSRQPDGSLKWRGWMQVQGGFGGPHTSGCQPYRNEALGFSLLVPPGFQAQQAPNAAQVMILAPGVGHPGEERAAAFITVEAANGRSAEQVAADEIAALGPGFNVTTGPALDIDGAPALAVSGLPGQDANRQVFLVHNDRLYRLLFVPDTPQAGEAYQQMLLLYAITINTFHLLP